MGAVPTVAIAWLHAGGDSYACHRDRCQRRGFGFFNLMVLRPLPIRSPNTLLRFKRRAPKSYAYQMPYPEMAFFRQYSKTLSAVIAVSDAKLAIEGDDKWRLCHNSCAGNFTILVISIQLHTWGAVGVFVVMVAVAALLPARRALRVDPLRSLRYE
jgi:hypothetical protein